MPYKNVSNYNLPDSFSVTPGKNDCLFGNKCGVRPREFCCGKEYIGKKAGFEMTVGNWPLRSDVYTETDCKNIKDCPNLCMHPAPVQSSLPSGRCNY